MSSNQNIIDTKSAFLRTQIRLLSAPLHPSPDWSTTLPPSSTTSTTSDTTQPLPQKTLTDTLSKLNAKLKSHNRLVFSLPSQRHVAEQIDTLYWRELTAASATSAIHDRDTVWVSRDADLCDSGVLSGLPESLITSTPTPTASKRKDGDTNNDDGEEEEGLERYEELRARAVEMARKRDQLRERVQGCRRLRTLLEGFEDARGAIQPNLVTRDGEVSRELERMRVLIARVEGRVRGLDGDGEDDVEDEDEDGEEEEETGENGGGNMRRETRTTTLSGQQKLARIMDIG